MITKRQGLLGPGGLVGGLLPTSGGLVGGLLPSISVGLPPLLGGGPTTSNSASDTSAAGTPTSTRATPSETTPTVTSSPLVSSPIQQQPAITTPAPTPIELQPVLQPVTLTSVSTITGGGVVTILTTVPGSPSTATTTAALSQPSAGKPTGFFANKPLAAGVLSAAGIVLLVILAALFTAGLRRRVRKRQDKEARAAAMIHEGFREHRFDDDDDRSTGHESQTGGQPMQAGYAVHNTPMRQPVVAGYSIASKGLRPSRFSPFASRPAPTVN